MKNVSSLGPLEQEIMDIIWKKESVTVRDVVTVLQTRREIAYTTVMTIMSRLVKKGFLHQTKEGKTNIFVSQKNQHQTLHTLVQQTLQTFVDRFGQEAVAAFLDEADALSHKPKKNSTKQ